MRIAFGLIMGLFLALPAAYADHHEDKHEHEDEHEDEHHGEHHDDDDHKHDKKKKTKHKHDKKKKTEHKHRRHGSHEHGKVEISLAVEGKEAKLSWESPTESVYGFEHTAKTEKDKAQQKAGLDKLEDEFFTMFAFPKDAGCELSKIEIEVEAEEETEEHDDHDHGKKKTHHSAHAEVEADFNLTCKKPLKGSEVGVDIGKVFPNVKTVEFKYLSGSKQAKKDLAKGKGKIQL